MKKKHLIIKDSPTANYQINKNLLDKLDYIIEKKEAKNHLLSHVCPNKNAK